MSSEIKVYKYGLHRGEERLVAGNRASGMVNFGGCHLTCNFCYTPETSVQKLGTDMSAEEFLHVLAELKLSGAQNINLISPTHLWRKIEPVLAEFRRDLAPELPLVLKISGFESRSLVLRMAQLADVFVPDFKVWSTDLAASVALPKRYGEVALFALQEMMKSHAPEYSSDGHLRRGILVRHLLMPGQLLDSQQIIERLIDIEFNGALNLMTQFFEPATRKLLRASAADLNDLVARAARGKFSLLIDGKTQEIAYA